jgi:5-methylcytosine-specific restriction protein A
MSHYPFIVNEKYTKSDIYRICNVPVAKQKGNWNTGYTNYEGDWFIFCGVYLVSR